MEHNHTSRSLVTYKIVSDVGGRLRSGARTACNFWNGFLLPSAPIVIRLAAFTSLESTLTRAYAPYRKAGTLYGRVAFNAVYLGKYTDEEVAGLITHEIGCTLGVGWETWAQVLQLASGTFLNDLGDDHYEDDQVLLTAFQAAVGGVFPIPLDVGALLSQGIIERLASREGFDQLLKNASQLTFTRHGEAQAVDRDYFEETELVDHTPHAVRLRA